ncbi:hypothetical protein SORBI_3010G069000 [Sorghum bicolor]|uniref:Secreted protein n=1 Tax=Sorghum bicolor TaxID=4558 RepID=A0A194YHR3_SORBI|nr:hypothetical protein SORBI_3010G069000 [Sorghum bicolor]
MNMPLPLCLILFLHVQVRSHEKKKKMRGRGGVVHPLHRRLRPWLSLVSSSILRRRWRRLCDGNDACFMWWRAKQWGAGGTCHSILEASGPAAAPGQSPPRKALQRAEQQQRRPKRTPQRHALPWPDLLVSP